MGYFDSCVPGNKEDYRTKHANIHDRMYAGFKTLDQQQDGECPRITHSGWWFAHREYLPVIDHIVQPEPEKLNCFHDVKTDTNLNGIYDDDPNQNQRAIILCNEKDVYKCITYSFEDNFIDGIYSVYINFSNIESIKLKQTKMYLGRK